MGWPWLGCSGHALSVSGVRPAKRAWEGLRIFPELLTAQEDTETEIDLVASKGLVQLMGDVKNPKKTNELSELSEAIKRGFPRACVERG